MRAGIRGKEGQEVGGRTLIMTPTHGENVEREHVNPMEVNADGIGRKPGERRAKARRRRFIWLNAENWQNAEEWQQSRMAIE